MTRAILTLNAGSSSLKCALFGEQGDVPMAAGSVDRIGPAGRMSLIDDDGVPIAGVPIAGASIAGASVAGAGDLSTHAGALEAMLAALRARWPGLDLLAIGHRVVHGGTDFAAPVIVDAATIGRLETLSPFAPLHQPHNLAGIRTAMALFPEVAQVACFDTAFHRHHPWVNDAFALPRALYDEGVRRYGFHGLSYEYVTGELARIAPDIAAGRVVIAHLGNGASMCAVEAGRSVASTMGFSALDGLPMGTRCGQLDPGVVLYLMDQKGMDAAAISEMLYTRSGLLGLSGLSNDMRELEAATTPEAVQAIDYFVFRCQREIGGLAAAMGGIEALVFCGGIGEHSALIRERICERLGWMGIAIDPERNRGGAARLSSPDMPVQALIVPTNEELVIARAARSLVGNAISSAPARDRRAAMVEPS